MLKIVLTGGPCSGKTTGLSRLENNLNNKLDKDGKRYKVLIVPEVATELMKAGLSLDEVGRFNFQDAILSMQISKNEEYVKQALIYEKVGYNVILIFDRGAMDSKAYMPQDEWYALLEHQDVLESNLLNFYDGVFHLKTVGYLDDGYTTENNQTRSESKEQAVELDKKTVAAWTGHSHLRVIDNCDNFDDKINNLLKGIYNMLGIPTPLEIERKFLIKMPNLIFLQKAYNAIVTNIMQTYLESNDVVERRIRQVGLNGNFTYFYTEKTSISGLTRFEKERKVSKEEYLILLMEADSNLRYIKKDRYHFIWNDISYELDVYPFWDEQAILEIELTSETDEIIIPNGINVIREVTEDPSFKNHQLAKR